MSSVAPLITVGVIVAVLLVVVAVAVHDYTQKSHSILRAYPLLGRFRYLLERIRPEIQQYFIERNWDGRPFDRDTRSAVYDRAKGSHGDQAFGTERDVLAPGHEFLAHSTAPIPTPDTPPRVLVGGPDCSAPYSMSLLNISAMSFGSLSANAVLAMNKGAAMGGFAHDTGEGGLTEYHLRHGADLIWEIGSGYFGTRTADGAFDLAQFGDKSSHENVKCTLLKLSQGAKPGLGGVLPGSKVTPELAAIRGVPAGETCISPPAHTAFSTPTELIELLATMRETSGGKPVGFKMCVGSRRDVLAICKAMLAVGTTPDFIVVDGSEGGTGAAPVEFEDHVGLPLTHGLMTMHNALVGVGLRDRIKIGAAGKVALANDIVKRLAQGADYTNSARAMMMAVGCIQAQKCHTDACPTGVATQNPRFTRALVVDDKATRVYQYHKSTVEHAVSMMAAMGVDHPDQLTPDMLRINVDTTGSKSYAEIYDWLQPGELLTDPPPSWQYDWQTASADSFRKTIDLTSAPATKA